MNSPESLLEFHGRCHLSLRQLLEHCGTLSSEELHRKLEGFGYPTVQLQLHHVMDAERYWLGVLQGRMDVDEDEAAFPSVELLEELRALVSGASESYLRGTSPEDLNEPREVTTWRGERKSLVPAQVIIRTLVHIYHHQGQILAMCRLLGKPATGFDYPIEP